MQSPMVTYQIFFEIVQSESELWAESQTDWQATGIHNLFKSIHI